MAPAALWATGATVSVAGFDFNDGFQGWTPQQGTGLEWTVEQVAPAGHANSFSQFDPADVSSLFTRPPQLAGYKTKSYVTSPDIHIQEDATLSFYVGFAGFYAPMCSLQLQVSDNDFADWKVIWNSKNEMPQSSWKWYKISVSLDEFKGKTEKFRFYYTTGTDKAWEDAGGYMGDFAIDNFVITAESREEAEPPADGPFAIIGLPVNYRNTVDFLPVVPPYKSVAFTDLSTGNPTLTTWKLTGLMDNPYAESVFRNENPVVEFVNTGQYDVKMMVQNELGVSLATEKIDVAYDAEVTNLRKGDKVTNLALDGRDWFPGSNKKGITAYAEKFGAPPCGILVSGVNVRFTRVEISDEMDGMMSVGVHLYSSYDGRPAARLASAYRTVSELAEVGVSPQYISFEFEDPACVSDEYFIVIDGIPTSSNGSAVNFGMATRRGERGSGMVKTGGEWNAEGEYSEGEGYSFAITANIGHSVFLIDEGMQTEYDVKEEAGEVRIRLRSNLPLREYETDCDWLTFSAGPEGFEREVTIGYEALPKGIAVRDGWLTFGDGVESLTVHITQTAESGIEEITGDSEIEIYTISGLKVYSGPKEEIALLPPGVYIVKDQSGTYKIIKTP